MNTISDLEIILITYNRKNYLNKTLSKIFSNDSPIKDCKITILDNKSSDGSSELIAEYAQKYPNLTHIRHNRNICGNGNIARAFEIATKKYLWILCDDDEYDWSHWDDVELAMDEDYDLIVVSNYLNPQKNTAQLVKQLTFVPAGIYKTENITDTVMANTEFSIANVFPHLATSCKVINDKKRIYVLDHWIVNMCINSGFESYRRGFDDDVHPYHQGIFLHIGLANSVQMLKDKKLRHNIIENIDYEGRNFYNALINILDLNNNQYLNSLPRNLTDLFLAMNFRQRVLFFIALIDFTLFRQHLIKIKNHIKDSKTKQLITCKKTNEKVKNIKNNYKDQKICFYGAGIFAKQFFENYDLTSLNIIGVIDGNIDKRGSKICGYTIYSIDDIAKLKPDVIVLTVLEKKYCLPFLEQLKEEKHYDFNIVHKLFQD